MQMIKGELHMLDKIITHVDLTNVKDNWQTNTCLIFMIYLYCWTLV